jgi:hypothetical protein
MSRVTTPIIIIAAALAIVAGTAAAAGSGSAEGSALLDGYAALASKENPSFAGFSADRGRALYIGPHAGGGADTSACAACHTPDPKAQGRHYKTGRAIEPMAASANPARFTDPAQVEKRFGRDCPNVLGRDCTATEKGDFITYLKGQ